MPVLQVFKAGRLAYASEEAGLKPLAHIYFTQPELLVEAEVHDKIVGEAAARLFVMAGVKKVRAKIASKGALERLRKARIPATAEHEVDIILNSRHDAICPMEKMSNENPADGEFLAAVRAKCNI